MARCCPRLPPPAPDDRGDMVLGWLLKLSVVLSLCGLALYDAISITSTTAAVADEGAYAARVAAVSYEDTGDVQLAYDAAVAAAAEKNPKARLDPNNFRIDPDGTVRLSIERSAKTIVIYRVGPIAHWAKINHEASGRPKL